MDTVHLHGRALFVGELSPAEHALATELLATTPEAVLHPGKMVQVGWFFLKFAAHPGGLAVLEPDCHSVPLRWQAGLKTIIHHLHLQIAVGRLAGIGSHETNLHETVCIDTAIFASHHDLMVMDRKDDDLAGGSGWFLGPADPSSDYSTTEGLDRISLYEAAIRYPQIIPFLMLPCGTQVMLYRNREFRIYRPDEQTIDGDLNAIYGRS